MPVRPIHSAERHADSTLDWRKLYGSIKQGTRFGFSRWSKQEDEIFRKFLVAYYDKNPGEPLFAPEYRCLYEKVRLAGFDKSARDVYLRYFKHWRERLGFPTLRQWCIKRLFYPHNGQATYRDI